MTANIWRNVNEWGFISSAFKTYWIPKNEITTMKKNTAGQNISLSAVTIADGSPFNGTVAVTVTKDNGTPTLGAGTVTNTANGSHNYAPTQAETNADFIEFSGSATGAVVSPASAYTEFDANIIAIDGDSSSGTNLKYQFDGTTGLTGDNFAARQDQLSGTGTGSGGNNTRVGGFTLNSGSVASGDYEDTYTVDNVYHQIQDVAGNLDIEYNGNVGSNGTCQNIKITGRINGSNDDLDGIYAWNYTALDWDRIGDYDGKNGSSDDIREYDLDIQHTGFGANDGDFIIRFLGTSLSNANLYIDKIALGFGTVTTAAGLLHSGIAQGGSLNTIIFDVGASAINGFYNHAKVITTFGTGVEQENIITSYDGTTKTATVKFPWSTVVDATTGFDVISAMAHCATASGGYENQAVYIDISDGAAGTEIGVNGTSDNPSNNFADARVIADAVGVKKFIFDRGTGLPVLDQSYIGWRFEVRSATAFDLNGQDVSSSVFNSAALLGTATGTGLVTYEQSGIFGITTPRCNFVTCSFSGETILTDTGKHTGITCSTNADSAASPILNINGDNITPTVVNLEYTGKLVLKNITPVDVVTISGSCQLEIDSSCTGGDLTLLGDIPITDNSGNVTISTGNVQSAVDNTVIIEAKIDAVGNIVTNQPTTAEFEARTLPTADYFDASTDAVTINSASVDSIFAGGNVDGYSLDESLRLILAASAAKLSGAATSNILIRDTADTKNRIDATVDANGNRTGITLDAT